MMHLELDTPKELLCLRLCRQEVLCPCQHLVLSIVLLLATLMVIYFIFSTDDRVSVTHAYLAFANGFGNLALI